MERLTNEKHGSVRGFRAPDEEEMVKMYSKLAAYEDCNLTPEEITILAEKARKPHLHYFGTSPEPPEQYPDWFTIAVDFDGTLCTNAFPDIGEPRPLMIEYIKQQAARGAKIILHTCRENGNVRRLLDEAVTFCEKHEIPLYAVNMNPDNHFSEIYGSGTGRKIHANLYIDDRAVNAADIERQMERDKDGEPC